MLRRAVLATAALALAQEAERQREIISESQQTIPYLRSLLCGKVDDAKLLHLVAVVGADAQNRTDRFRQVHLREHKVAGPSLTRWRLRGAASTAGFDFRRFSDVDVVLAPSVLAYWQELTAAYPRAKLTLILGEPHARPTKDESRTRLEKCSSLRDSNEAEELMAAYGSACPSSWQRAKVEDQVVAEILETFPSDRLQVLAAGQGWFTPYRPKALNGKVFWTAPHLEKISRNYQVGVDNRSYYDVNGSVLVPRGGNPKTSVLGKRPYAWESIRKATPWLDSPWHHRDDVVSESRGEFFADKSQEDLYVCPGGGSTATHSLILALTALGVEEEKGKKLDHFGHALQATTTAAEDDDFNWLLFDKFAGVSDTPIPGFWRELAEAYPRSKHLLTVRRHYHRSYPRRIETRQFGIESADWRRLAEGHFVRNIGYAFEPNWCYAENKCAEACGELLESGTSHLELLKDLGDARCAMTGPSSRDAASYARKSASLLLGLSKEEEMQHKSRLPVYHALCPTQLQAVKVTRNANRHVLRRVPADRLATFNIVDEHDGFSRLCPFLGMDHGPCSGELGAFPRATFTEEKKQRHGQVGHGRRLNSCFCRKAFKEIGRDWGRHTNTTDDDDDTAVEAPAVEAPAVEAPAVEAPTSTKKKALPAFALDFGNGA